eukprot:CAMPEP_0170578048 /NCGR_PEP_ID=MMETSP0224-20130122/5252_1 /TAXON_ID=285029 /ORGANISM="Togula jolla, Strain CCCM 725" /LENGTH=413 /DNA_ID=CAMNT_0010900999 /DNA_START=47 /DNA_END=1288 /DNA_ORIENTATION=+
MEKPPNIDAAVDILKHPISLLLLCLPFGIVSAYRGWGHQATFWLNFTAMIPLAKILGDATEELAVGLKNNVLAGLLNATFGNAVEMVLTVQTLRAGLLDVVKATLLGSILSNLLLVLGMSFFFGGIIDTVGKKQGMSLISTSEIPEDEPAAAAVGYGELAMERVQHFSVMTALVNTSLLLLSCLSFSLVTVFYSEADPLDPGAMEEILLPVSRQCSIVIVIAYVASIFFQLVTHRESMADEADEDDEDDGHEEPKLSVAVAVGVMSVTTAVVAYSSHLLVDSLEGVVEHAHISSQFIGIILLPIVGNACEHMAAVRFAIQDKPGLSIGIAVGSSTQIALFVVPFTVLVGWALDKPMDLNYGSLNTTVMSMSVIIVLSVVVDGSSNWLQGYLLVSAYTLIAMLYWYLPDAESVV